MSSHKKPINLELNNKRVQCKISSNQSEKETFGNKSKNNIKKVNLIIKIFKEHLLCV